MSKPAIYVETSVISYLVARPSRDLIVAAHQQLTSDWWNTKRQGYDLFISEIVLDEARAGDEQEAAKRVAALQDLSLLEINEDAMRLAEKLYSKKSSTRRTPHCSSLCKRDGLSTDMELQTHREC